MTKSLGNNGNVAKKSSPLVKKHSTNIILVGLIVLLLIGSGARLLAYNRPLSATQLASYKTSDLLYQLDSSRCSQETKFTSLTEALENSEKACSLDLGFSDTNEIPADIGRLTNLQELRARGIDIKTLPPEIGQLQKLRLLDVMDSTLESLPSEIGNLGSLEKLELGGTSLTKLPPEIGQLQKLTFLDLMDVPINDLPPEIGQVKNLEDLDIDETGITDLSPLRLLSHLERLIVDYTKLGTLSAEVYQLTSIKELSLSSATLTTLDPQIANLKNLKRLNLSLNKLTDIPKEIGQLKNLKQLDVSGNPLSPTEKQQLKKLLPKIAIKGLD